MTLEIWGEYGRLLASCREQCTWARPTPNRPKHEKHASQVSKQVKSVFIKGLRNILSFRIKGGLKRVKDFRLMMIWVTRDPKYID